MLQIAFDGITTINCTFLSSNLQKWVSIVVMSRSHGNDDYQNWYSCAGEGSGLLGFIIYIHVCDVFIAALANHNT